MNTQKLSLGEKNTLCEIIEYEMEFITACIHQRKSMGLLFTR